MRIFWSGARVRASGRYRQETYKVNADGRVVREPMFVVERVPAEAVQQRGFANICVANHQDLEETTQNNSIGLLANQSMTKWTSQEVVL